MTDTADIETAAEVVDEARSALLEALVAELGDSLVEHHLVPGVDLWVRVKIEAFGDTAAYLHERQRFRYFDFISAIDWLPSPFGRSLDAHADNVNSESVENEAAEMTTGYAGGDTRFQVFGRLHNLTTGLGITIKADLADDALVAPSWTDHYPGAEWHETRGVGDVRHHVHRSPGTASALPSWRLRGQPDAQGLPTARPFGQAVARHRGCRTNAFHRKPRGRIMSESELSPGSEAFAPLTPGVVRCGSQLPTGKVVTS